MLFKSLRFQLMLRVTFDTTLPKNNGLTYFGSGSSATTAGHNPKHTSLDFCAGLPFLASCTVASQSARWMGTPLPNGSSKPSGLQEALLNLSGQIGLKSLSNDHFTPCTMMAMYIKRSIPTSTSSPSSQA